VGDEEEEKQDAEHTNPEELPSTHGPRRGLVVRRQRLITPEGAQYLIHRSDHGTVTVAPLQQRRQCFAENSLAARPPEEPAVPRRTLDAVKIAPPSGQVKRLPSAR
jgi:hypothetical protein